ncbi:putative iron-regulated protein [Azospirillum brasilense]|uniref:Putative iron-regulated protein n=1 Tax=Azospirillum brasilense TaxID=192 RepID=A0A560CNJ4_AZOBR|nr:ChaN family lipoprotein [Azospirillum brasilense]TWA86435.1 putative iron-regulated protein [Azospirillum brasilense]
MLPRLMAALLLSGGLLAGLGDTAAAQAAARTDACVPPGGWADAAARPLNAADLLRRAAASPAVLLGERHDDADHHRWQLHSLAALHALNPDLAVGMEMFPRSVQPVLDRWSAGQLTEAELLRETNWPKVWGYDARFYLPILHFARMNRLPVVALNIDRGLVSRTAREGWAAVPAGEREGVGDPAPPPASYTERLRQVMAAHGPTERRSGSFERFVEAQSVWDRAMAERIAETHRQTNRTVVAILGQGHIEGRDGVPHQLADLGVRNSVVLLPWDEDRPCAELDGRIADAVYGLGESEAPAETPRPRLGVMLEPGPEGVRVRSVTEGSVAAAAGLTAGDLVVAAAGSPVREATDLTAVVQRQAPGTWLPLTVKREQGTAELVAKFPAAPTVE